MTDPVVLVVLLQPEPLPLMTDMVRFVVGGAAFVAVVIVAMYFVFKYSKPKTDLSAAAKAREEFEKSKEVLLLAAQAKKAAQESDASAKRQSEMEEKERELLRENVDPLRVIGQACPLCGLEMAEDQELVIDPYTGQGYHFSSFLNDWPAGAERPRFVYRYPQGTVVKSTDLVRGF